MPRTVATATMASFASLALRAIVPGNHCFSSHCAHRWPKHQQQRGEGWWRDVAGSGAGGVGIRTRQSRVPAARVRDKRVTSGPFTQNAFVRPDILIPMPTRETEQRRYWRRRGPPPIHRQSVKSPNRVPLKAVQRFALSSIRLGRCRAT